MKINKTDRQMDNLKKTVAPLENKKVSATPKLKSNKVRKTKVAEVPKLFLGKNVKSFEPDVSNIKITLTYFKGKWVLMQQRFDTAGKWKDACTTFFDDFSFANKTFFMTYPSSDYSNVYDDEIDNTGNENVKTPPMPNSTSEENSEV